MCAGKSRTFGIPAKSTTHTFDPICAHGFAVAGTAKDDAPLNFTRCYCDGRRTNEERIIDRLFRISSEVDYFMARINKIVFDYSFVAKSGVV